MKIVQLDQVKSFFKIQALTSLSLHDVAASTITFRQKAAVAYLF